MIGTSLKRYEIKEELGQGGMSVVYLGRDTALDRDVAVKVLHEHLAKDPDNRERFRREAEAIARLEHPHILDVFDFSGEEDERSFIVMEYIPGMNLRDFIDAHGPPPPEIAAMIGTVVADALAHAHDHGVIHRDLKPENIMVSDEGTLKLMDFGIAHVADAETMTQTGNLLGSPAHMAPEIIDGRDVNRRSDIFSFGTVLYWLSTGQFPFEGDNAPHLLRQVLECNYDDPETVEPRMPRELSRIICTCLSKDPDDRFSSVEELRERLDETVDLLDEIDVAQNLESYFNDPEAYTEEFESVIVDRLIERGRAAMERDDVPEAIAHFNRVLGYEPDNEEVQRELEQLDREEHRPAQIAVAAGLVLAITATVLYVMVVPGGGPGAAVPAAQRAAAEAVAGAELAHAEASARSRGASRARSVHRGSRRAATRLLADRLGRRSIALAQGVASDDRPGPIVVDQRIASDEPSVAERETSDVPDVGAASGPDAGAASPPDAGTERDAGGTDDAKRLVYKFKILPLAATVYIDGREMSVPDVVDGVPLTVGNHRIRIESDGCKSYETRFRVGPDIDRKMSVVLDWKPATVRVISNRPAFVYLDGDKSRSYPIGVDGQNARIRIPFGEADSSRRETKRDLTLEIRPRGDPELVRRQKVELRPGRTRSVNVNFPRDG